MCSRRDSARLPPGRRVQLARILCGCALAVICPPTVAAREPAEAERALAFFATLPAGDIAVALRSRRPSPVSLDDRNREIGRLPRNEILRPRADEKVKLATLTQVLVFHERRTVVDVEIIDVVQAFVGLHARSILLISRPALQLVSSAELQALVAHEIGHEYFWDEYQRADQRNDTHVLRDVELKCDGIAALTLVELGLDPRIMTSALRKLTRFNKKLGATANFRSYPAPSARERFALAVLALRAQSESRR
jgi:Peptidase family M48